MNIPYMILQGLFLLFLAPLIAGIVKKTKALLQNRRGPHLFQVYRDIYKYMKKDAVVSEQTSWLFVFTPYLVFASILGAGLMLPVFHPASPWPFSSDLLVFIYLLTMARFFMALAALDTGSAFGGMGASREMAVSSVIEPALVAAIAGLAFKAHTTDLGKMVSSFMINPSGIFTPNLLLLLVAFYIILIAESGRIPVDNPDTHLELTMIHEGMLLEYSGKYLGLMVWASYLKQLLLYSIVAAVFLPWGITSDPGLLGGIYNLFFYVLKVVFIGVLVAVTETAFVKIRLFQIPELLFSSLVLSFLSILMEITVGGR